MPNHKIFDLYTNYLLTSFSYTTATGLSELVDGELSHDPITRFLSREDLTLKTLWKAVKQEVREILDHYSNVNKKTNNDAFL